MKEPQSIAAQLQQKAARVLAKSSSKQEAALLAKIAKLSDQLLEIENEAREIGNLKSATQSLTGAERRVIAAPLAQVDQYPPDLVDVAAIKQAIKIICRFIPELVEANRTYLTGRQNDVAAKAAPIRAELVQLRDELEKIQSELSAS